MITVLETSIYRGPSVWASTPAVRLLVDLGDLEHQSTMTLPGFIERLLKELPSLEDHRCTVGRRGGFVKRMCEGTPLSHVLEHSALEVQRLAGTNVSRSKTRQTATPGIYNVIVAYRQERVGLAAAELAVRLVNHLAGGVEPDFDFRHELAQIIRLAERLAYGPSTLAIVEEAERRDIPILRLHPTKSLVQLGHGRHQRRIWATVASTTSDVAVDVAADKELTNQLLSDVGIPSPRGVVVTNVDAAVEAADDIGYPVVVKPLDGNHGRGVRTNLGDEDAVRINYPAAAAESRNGLVFVERFITGKDYRVLVVDGNVVAVAERLPAHVVGDGERTVRQLIDSANADPRRGYGHEKVLTRIEIDEHTIGMLTRQGLSLDSLVEVGRFVSLKQTGNMSTGGTAIDCTDAIHPDNVEIAREAALVVGLDVAGIDFITPDISRSIHEVGGAIVEVNAAPGFRMHTHPTEGLPRNVGRAVVEMLFPRGQSARIPIVAITGTNGKTTTTRMIAHIMQMAGHRVGLTSSDGIYVNGTLIEAGDMAGPQSARMVLKNPRVDFAVLETARGGIVRSGLGFDRCDVGVVTNIASDHLGMKGVETMEDLARVKSVVPASVSPNGTSVLNADNAWTVEMARVAQGEIIFFSMDRTNPIVQDHVRGEGRAVVLAPTPRGDMLTLIDHRRETSILLAQDIPATADGRIRVNVANALAATAAAIASDVDLSSIRDGLRSFTSSFAQTPGRFNMLSIEGRQVVIDYGHNAHGLEAIADFVKRTAAHQSVGVIAIAGDRRDEDIRAFGELAARTFDRLIIREHDDPRGRERGEVAAILLDAARAAAMPEDKVEVIIDELDAVHAAIDLANPGDLVFLLVYRISQVWDSLACRAAGDGQTHRDPVMAK